MNNKKEDDLETCEIRVLDDTEWKFFMACISRSTEDDSDIELQNRTN